MLNLSHKDGFVFYQLPNTNDIQLIQGEWRLENSIPPSIQAFVITDLEQSGFHVLEGEHKKWTSEVKISTSEFSSELHTTNKEEYLSKAKYFIAACENELNKVILSRRKVVENKNINIYSFFESICNKYQHSFNYLLNIPGKGMWIGASPEHLISGKKGNYSTVSLAGSKKTSNNNPWTNKEYEEQQYVTDYIASQLKDNNVVYSYQKQPITIEAGNISHLQTSFTIESELPAINIANILHPTPAICGIPKKLALDFIQKNEGYDREFYTGYLGLNSIEESDLYINLRSLRIYADKICLFVGGGITKKSIAENEWQETELKAQTLLSVIEKM